MTDFIVKDKFYYSDVKMLSGYTEVKDGKKTSLVKVILSNGDVKEFDFNKIKIITIELQKGGGK